jgi:hypothetical protein
MNGVPEQIELQPSLRQVSQTFRIGPARRGVSDPSYVTRRDAFDGIGLRPYAPVHLRARVVSGGDTAVSWIRRTRIDGGNWSAFDVPLGEAREQYVVQVLNGDRVLREALTEASQWTYPAAARAADQPPPGSRIAVAQVSDRFGPGAFAHVALPAV